LNVAGRDGFVGLAVVFDVIGAKTAVAEVDVHVAVGGGYVAFSALCLCFQIGDSAFRGG
jgi:hypothetical protein